MCHSEKMSNPFLGWGKLPIPIKILKLNQTKLAQIFFFIQQRLGYTFAKFQWTYTTIGNIIVLFVMRFSSCYANFPFTLFIALGWKANNEAVSCSSISISVYPSHRVQLGYFLYSFQVITTFNWAIKLKIHAYVIQHI